MMEDIDKLKVKFDEILINLCQESNIDDPIKVRFTSQLDNKNNNAECHPNNKIILIKPNLSSINMIRSLYHEFEHYYQYKYHSDYYKWWMDNEKRNIYEKYYKNFINFIEEDARIFGNSFGKANGRFLFKLIPIEKFDCLNGKCDSEICSALDCLEEEITCHILIQGLSNN